MGIYKVDYTENEPVLRKKETRIITIVLAELSTDLRIFPEASDDDHERQEKLMV